MKNNNSTERLTKEDFEKSQFNEILKGKEDWSYVELFEELRKKETVLKNQQNLAENKVIMLIARICSFRIDETKTSNPYIQDIRFGQKNSATPDDFEDNEIDFLKTIVSDINHTKLKARIFDLLWIVVKPKQPGYALHAIDEFSKAPINTKDYWLNDGGDSINRGIQLCLLLKTKASDRLTKIEANLMNTLLSSDKNEGFLSLWIAEMLNKVNLNNEDKTIICQKLDETADAFNKDSEYREAIDYYNVAGYYYRKIGNNAKYADLLKKTSEAWIKESSIQRSNNVVDNFIRADCLDKAIKILLDIPREFRDDKFDAALEDLKMKAKLARKDSLMDFPLKDAGRLDLSEIIHESIHRIKDKDPPDALWEFCNLFPPIDMRKLYENTKDMLKNSIGINLFPEVHLSSDGRIIARQNTEDNEEEIYLSKYWPRTMYSYKLHISACVCGAIIPALETLKQEHRIMLTDCFLIALKSQIIPQDRVNIIAKALYLGFENDFSLAIHLLVPQLENIVRLLLKNEGIKTTTKDSSYLENEIGLSALVDQKAVNKIFGEAFALEIRALFCDPFGPNLRNNLAHGLLSSDDCENVYSVYAWWLMMRFVFNTFWHMNISDKKETDEH